MLRKSFCFSFLFLFLFTFLFFHCSSTSGNENEIPDKETDSFIVLEGTVNEVIVSKRTLGEYRYYVINIDKTEKTILFNEKSFSAGFKKYINKKVKIKGITSIGFIGWRKIQKTGIKVLEIVEI